MDFHNTLLSYALYVRCGRAESDMPLLQHLFSSNRNIQPQFHLSTFPRWRHLLHFTCNTGVKELAIPWKSDLFSIKRHSEVSLSLLLVLGFERCSLYLIYIHSYRPWFPPYSMFSVEAVSSVVYMSVPVRKFVFPCLQDILPQILILKDFNVIK